MDAKSKPVWMSKTWGVNLVLASYLEFHPHANAWLMAHPQTAILICVGLNLFMRHFSTTALHYGVKK